LCGGGGEVVPQALLIRILFLRSSWDLAPVLLGQELLKMGQE
jgi:hypothetical protein